MSDKMRRVVVLGFAVFGLLGVLAVIFIALMIWRVERRWVPEPAPIEAKVPGERFAVADTNELTGVGVLEIIIATEASLPKGGGSYSSSSGPLDERNVILLDKASGANRRLLTDNRRHIVQRRYLPAGTEVAELPSNEYEAAADGDRKPAPPPAAYYLLRVRTADGRSEDVLLGDLKSGRQAFVLTGIDGVDRIWMQSPTRVAMLMRQGRKLFFRAFEMPDLKLVAARPIEID